MESLFLQKKILYDLGLHYFPDNCNVSGNLFSNILIKISKLPLYNIEYFHEMLTKFPDILHNVIRIDYKCLTCQKIAKVPKIIELERVLYKQKNPCLCKKTVKSIFFIMYLLSEHITNH